MKSFTSRIWLPLLLFLFLIWPRVLPSYYLGLMNQALILALFAMSLDLLVGSVGLPSLGHAAFFGTGAYVAGFLYLHGTVNFWLCLAGGTGAGLIVSGLFGFLAVRTRGSYFLMITLALAQVLWGIAYKWRRLTGGDDGLPGIGRPDLGLPLPMHSPIAYYYLTLVMFVFAAVLLMAVVSSPFGQALKGIRESESRMAALGYPVVLYKYLCFIFAGGFAAVSGVLFLFYNRFVSPSDLDVVLSAKGLLMVILGGAGTLWGPALGAGIIVLLENIVSAFVDRWLMILGLIYVLVILFFPNGILGGFKGKALEQKIWQNL